jgi:hypothetical protein
MPNECLTDEAGTVIEPKLHDSNLTRIEWYDEECIKLSFKLISSDVKTIFLNGVEALACDGVKKGNIVLDLTIFSGISTPMDLLKKLYEEPKYERQKYDLFMDKIKNRILNGELQIIVLNPSYGCKLTALVSSITYE